MCIRDRGRTQLPVAARVAQFDLPVLQVGLRVEGPVAVVAGVQGAVHRDQGPVGQDQGPVLGAAEGPRLLDAPAAAGQPVRERVARVAAEHQDGVRAPETGRQRHGRTVAPEVGGPPGQVGAGVLDRVEQPLLVGVAAEPVDLPVPQREEVRIVVPEGGL